MRHPSPHLVLRIRQAESGRDQERLRDRMGTFQSGDKTIKQTPDTTSGAWTVKLAGDATVSAEVKEKEEEHA